MGAIGALQARIEAQTKEIEQLKAENASLVGGSQEPAEEPAEDIKRSQQSIRSAASRSLRADTDEHRARRSDLLRACMI